MSPGSLSFAKLVMMPPAPGKCAGCQTRVPTSMHSFNQRCPIQSPFQSVLGVRSFYVEHNNGLANGH